MDVSDRSSPEFPESPASPGASGSERRYDSFHVRVWWQTIDPTLLRVEIRHLQTGLVESAVAPIPSWILATMLVLLGTPPTPDESSTPDA